MGVVDTATNIAICNQSLGMLGAKPIVLNTTSENRTLCERFFADARDEILSCHPWNYGRKRANAIETTEPLFGYDHAFTMPSDCLRILLINDEPDAIWEREGDLILTNDGNTPKDWASGTAFKAGEYITSDDSGSDLTYLVDTAFTGDTESTDLSTYCTSQGGDYEYINVEYIYQVTDLSSYPVFLKKCVIYNLALWLCPAIKQSVKDTLDIHDRLYGNRARGIVGILQLGKSQDAQEAGGTVLHTQTWLNSRISGVNT